MAILLAAGRGERFGKNRPKQFFPIGGKPLFQYALETLASHPQIDRVHLVLPAEEIHFELPKMEKLESVLAGGEARHNSVWNALSAIELDPEDGILIHDAARACLMPPLISRVIRALESADAVTPVMDLTDAIMERQSLREADRDRYVALQTPQGFRSRVLKMAFEHFLKNAANFPKVHSEFEIVRDYLPGSRLATVPGERNNLKLTTGEDLALFERLLQNAQNTRKRRPGAPHF